MQHILNYLKNVWQNIKNESKNNFAFPFLFLLLVCIPLKLGVVNVLLGIFILFLFFKINHLAFNFNRNLIFPIVYFTIAALSYFWSIDEASTLNSIPRGIFFLLVPIIFLFIPKLNSSKELIIKFYSLGMLFCALFYLIRACIRYYYVQDASVFFYHQEEGAQFGLVPKELNAIHVSVFISVAYFYFLKQHKSIFKYIGLGILTMFLSLLSSKNILLVVFLMSIIYFFYFTNSSNKYRLRNLLIFLIVVSVGFFFGKIKNRFQEEFQSNTNQTIDHNVIDNVPDGVHYVSIYEAWNNESFTPNDYFPGTAFRVYQARMFFEFLQEDLNVLIGYGLDASQKKLEEKGSSYNVYLGTGKEDGYQNKNFHNQYIQTLADIGLISFLVLLTMLFVLFKKGIQNKDFSQISFSVLMFSVFLTESFLWRQRGVTFFVILYCIFMFEDKKQKSLIIQH